MSDEKHFYVHWIDHGREPANPPDPAYPDGIDVDRVASGDFSCLVALPYPAKRCGLYRVECKLCGMRLALTTAGRPDDPRSVRVPCQARSKPVPGPFSVN